MNRNRKYGTILAIGQGNNSSINKINRVIKEGDRIYLESIKRTNATPISGWSDLSKIYSESHDIIMDDDGDCAYICKKDKGMDGFVLYLSTHTFYDRNEASTTRILQSYGFNCYVNSDTYLIPARGCDKLIVIDENIQSSIDADVLNIIKQSIESTKSNEFTSVNTFDKEIDLDELKSKLGIYKCYPSNYIPKGKSFVIGVDTDNNDKCSVICSIEDTLFIETCKSKGIEIIMPPSKLEEN